MVLVAGSTESMLRAMGVDGKCVEAGDAFNGIRGDGPCTARSISALLLTDAEPAAAPWLLLLLLLLLLPLLLLLLLLLQPLPPAPLLTPRLRPTDDEGDA